MSGRNSVFWRDFWEQAFNGGDTTVSIRILDADLRKMIDDLAAAEARIAEVERERDDWKKAAEVESDAALECAERAESAERRAKELRKYVKHLGGCDLTSPHYNKSVHICTCGLDALAEGQGEK